VTALQIAARIRKKLQHMQTLKVDRRLVCKNIKFPRLLIGRLCRKNKRRR